MTSQRLTVYTDGGSRGNPGPAAASFVITDHANNMLIGKAFYLGSTTNNVAEYTGLLKGLEEAGQLGASAITIKSDSELMVRQLNGQYKVKSPALIDLYSSCMELLGGFKSWKIEHVRREYNQTADALVNRSLDIRKDVEERPTPKVATKKLRLAILLSGGGTTMLNLLDNIKAGTLNAEIVLVVSSRSDIAGVTRAKAAGLRLEVIRKKDHPDINSFSAAIGALLDETKVDLVVQAGWLCLWHIPANYNNRVMNIHPALLPSFGGQGMWGHHVHEAVLKAGCKVSGCTVHFCTNEYDRGPIIVQRCCEVFDTDDADMLAARVFEQECIAYPAAIRLFAEGRLAVRDNIVTIKR